MEEGSSKKDLTAKQREILTFIEQEQAALGAPPTLRELQKAFRFKSIGTVQDHLRALIQKGFLFKDPKRARGLRTPETHRLDVVPIPILGAVTAGHPRDAEEVVLGTLPVPSHFAKKGKCFALKVSGDSMIHAGIHDGDTVIARSQTTAHSGEIVVAIVEGETTVKRLQKKEGRIFLLPENPQFSPIEIQSERSAIQGKVIGVQRFYE